MSDAATLIQEGNELAQEKKWGEALECYRAASALDPTNPEIWFLAGCCHFKMNHGPGAREAWERALKIDPSFEKARVWIHRVTGLSGQVPIAART
jgi:tetratricopeptide (TPR) repeat protein